MVMKWFFAKVESVDEVDKLRRVLMLPIWDSIEVHEKSCACYESTIWMLRNCSFREKLYLVKEYIKCLFENWRYKIIVCSEKHGICLDIAFPGSINVSLRLWGRKQHPIASDMVVPKIKCVKEVSVDWWNRIPLVEVVVDAEPTAVGMSNEQEGD